MIKQKSQSIGRLLVYEMHDMTMIEFHLNTLLSIVKSHEKKETNRFFYCRFLILARFDTI